MLLISYNDQTATILRPLTSVSVISAIISSSLNTLMSKSSDPTSSCGYKTPAIKITIITILIIHVHYSQSRLLVI